MTEDPLTNVIMAEAESQQLRTEVASLKEEIKQLRVKAQDLFWELHEMKFWKQKAWDLADKLREARARAELDKEKK